MPRWLSWLFDAQQSAVVGGVSLVLSAIGLILTLLGLYFTYRQASLARSAAEDADRAVENFRFRAAQYDSFRDLSEAAYALEVAKRHLTNDAWTDAGDSYEDARRALVRVRNNEHSLDAEAANLIDTMTSQMANFCSSVDRAKAGKRSFPDKSKCLQAIRKNYDRLTIVRHSVQKKV